jgi:multidrug efflux pump subunit AcrB
VRRFGVLLLELALACGVRLRPVLMTSLATFIGLLPLALKPGTGGEGYALPAQAIKVDWRFRW